MTPRRSPSRFLQEVAMTNTKNYNNEAALAEGGARKDPEAAVEAASGQMDSFNRYLSVAAETEKEWSEAGICNAFIFGKIMTTYPDLLLELLQFSLPEFHIQTIQNAQKEVDLKLAMDSHGIRLDVSTHDDCGRIINVEMQLRDEKNIPKRMRYYSGAIDQTLLEPGFNYSSLPETVILFITPFDPFGRSFLRYTFRAFCAEDRELELRDGTTKVVLNAVGTKGDITEGLRGFLQLVAGNLNVEKGSFADRVQEKVLIARQNSKWRREYMDWKMTLLNEREKGREEGRKEGREEGRKEGREEGGILEQIETIIKKLQKGKDLSEAADAMEKDVEELRPIWEAVKAAAPEFDRDKILRTVQK